MKTALSPQGSESLYFQAQGFCAEEHGNVFHGFFGRRGGQSTGIFSSLNCGAGSQDEPEAVKANRGIVAEHAGCLPGRLVTLYQVHSARCVPVREAWPEIGKPEADAMATDVPGLALGILTADCAPVLFYGEKDNGAPVIGAAHAGWGGAIKGVLSATLEEMQALGARLPTIRAAIGPCIGQSSYEVRDEFSAPFLAQDPDNERFFMAARREGHLMFDLPGYCALRLAKAGVGSVFIKDLDTYFHEEDFFSYRRKTHRNEVDYGRQMSVIMIRP
jgi:polyphenol oxidase